MLIQIIHLYTLQINQFIYTKLYLHQLSIQIYLINLLQNQFTLNKLYTRNRSKMKKQEHKRFYKTPILNCILYLIYKPVFTKPIKTGTILNLTFIRPLLKKIVALPSKSMLRYTQLEQHLQPRVKPHQRLGPQRPRRPDTVQVQHLVTAYHRVRLDRAKKKQSLVKAEQQQLFRGQHQQLRVELHHCLDPQRLRCLNDAHVHLLGELRSCRSLSRVKLSQLRATLYHLSNPLDIKTIITLFLFRIFIVSSGRIKNSSTFTPSPTPIMSSPTHPTRSTVAPTPPRTTRTSSSSRYPSPFPYPKPLSP